MEVKRILRYLKETSDYVMCYQGKDLRLVGYTNANWGGNLDQRKSTSRYAFLLMISQFHGVARSNLV